MNCAACRHENPVGSAFCEECGTGLERCCSSCGSACAPAAKYCRSCGASLAGTADTSGARKVVTIVFADLIGSTSLHERLDAESARRLMDRYYRALHVAVEAHGGTVTKLLGDGVMAVFGVPRVAEDDALRAVRAAVAVQHAFRELTREQWGSFESAHIPPGSAPTLTPGLSAKTGEGTPIPPRPSGKRASAGKGDNVGLRVAVNTGEVVVSNDHTDVVGDPVNVAARLQQEARDGDVLIGESTRRLVGHLVTLTPLGALTLKGRSETVAAYRVVSLDRPTGAAATPFVGREDELRRILAVYDAAVTARRAQLAVILGSPGLGKSRLLAEFARGLGQRATVLTAHCDVAGGATFAPLAEALRASLHVDDGDPVRAAVDAVVPGEPSERARIAAGVAALLAGTPAPPEETFFVVRRLLAALAAAQPVVLAIDDLQWAEPLLLDLTEHLVEWSTDVPLDAQGRAFGERAAHYLATAGRRALARDDLPLASSLLGRALDRLDAADPARAAFALDRCEALLSAGDVGPAVQAIAELGRFIGGSDRLRAWHTCFTGQLAVLTDPQALHATADAVAAAADELASAGDAAGEAKAHSVHALALARLGKIGAGEAALDKALAAARRAHDRRRANAVLAGAPLAALWGPSPVTRASGRCLDVVRVLRITQGAPAVEAVALRCQGVLEALARAHRCGTADDRFVSAHGRRAGHHAAVARSRRLRRAHRVARGRRRRRGALPAFRV